jgi:nicotinamidase-related amidase
MTKALLVIDVQNCFFKGDWPIPNADEFLAKVESKVEATRAAGDTTIIWVQNDGEEPWDDAPGRYGWQLVLEPQAGERVVRKSVPSVFKQNTDFAAELKQAGITHLELIGLQSDMCVRASALAAKHEGFDVTVTRELHATYDGGHPGSEDPRSASQISDEIQSELEQTLG